MIDIRKLKELVRLMVSNDLTELDLRDSEEQVTLRRSSVSAPPYLVSHGTPAHGNAQHHQSAAAPGGQTSSSAEASSSQSQPGGAVQATAEPPPSDAGLHCIESPMVGTFYTAANPDSPPFVQVGDRVTPDTVVCIVEAMKIFNEIKAECSGTIQSVLVENAQPVEFGQPLFHVKPE